MLVEVADLENRRLFHETGINFGYHIVGYFVLATSLWCLVHGLHTLQLRTEIFDS